MLKGNLHSSALYKLHANTSSKKDVSFAEAMQAVLEDVAGVRSSRGEKKKNAPPFGHLDRYSALELRADAQSPTQPTQVQKMTKRGSSTAH